MLEDFIEDLIAADCYVPGWDLGAPPGVGEIVQAALARPPRAAQ